MQDACGGDGELLGLELFLEQTLRGQMEHGAEVVGIDDGVLLLRGLQPLHIAVVELQRALHIVF